MSALLLPSGMGLEGEAARQDGWGLERPYKQTFLSE